MLPDLPAFKSDLEALFLRYFQSQVYRNLGVFRQAGRRIAHEGDRMRIIRGDGSIEDSDYKRASSEIAVKFTDIPNLTAQDRLRLIDQMAEDMADQMAGYMFASLNKTLEEAGQVVDNQGRPLDPAAILQVLEAIQVDFKPDGSHSPLTLVTAPGGQELAKKALEALHNDPEFRARHEELMQKKRMEWRDREAARKLVG